MQLKSLEDTKKFSKSISNIINTGDIIFLYGNIGVGKTTFVRFLINHLENRIGIKNSDVLSPTFNILHDYNLGDIQISHYDLYRMKNYKDILQLGMFETSKDYIKIVEWPELIKLKPENRIDIFFDYSKSMDFREVEIVGFGKWEDYRFNEF
jgi:tRNA threonylcarbamoyladenosine biosynthesis protein TsaE